MVCISAGYTLGWWAVLTLNLGTQCGCALGVLVSRRLMRASVEDKVATLPAGWARSIRLVQQEVSRSRLGFLFLAGLVGNCGLTSGLANAIYGALTDAPLPLIMAGVCLSSEWAIITDVYLGRLVRALSDEESASEAGSGEANATAPSDGSEAAAQRAAVVAQLCIAASLMTAVSLWARHRLSASSETRSTWSTYMSMYMEP